MSHTVRPYDPDAVAQLQALATQSAEKVARLLQRKADRADSLREVAANEGDEKAFKSAEALDGEVMLVIELIQDYKQLIQQHEADNCSAWAMIELQDRRTEGFKRLLAKRDKEFEQLRSAFQAYVRRNQAA